MVKLLKYVSLCSHMILAIFISVFVENSKFSFLQQFMKFYQNYLENQMYPLFNVHAFFERKQRKLWVFQNVEI